MDLNKLHISNKLVKPTTASIVANLYEAPWLSKNDYSTKKFMCNESSQMEKHNARTELQWNNLQTLAFVTVETYLSSKPSLDQIAEDSQSQRFRIQDDASHAPLQQCMSMYNTQHRI